jgi:hypothetical protein
MGPAQTTQTPGVFKNFQEDRTGLGLRRAAQRKIRPYPGIVRSGLSPVHFGAVADAAPPQNGSVTLTQAELDAMLAEREAKGRPAG